MKKEFIPYEQALALKELGFNEPCFVYHLEDGTRVPASYSKEGTIYPSNADLLPEWCTAPTFSQAFRWFREKYKLDCIIPPIGGVDFKTIGYYYEIVIEIPTESNIESESYNTYEEAELACIKKLIEIVKNK